ncbi:hypothetical protein JYT83_01355 [bacterium AH-315-F18]|nr:hypothetical protein [bacterium AH-315-F18]
MDEVCTEIRRELLAKEVGDGAPKGVAYVSEHLTRCVGCQAFLADVRAIDSHLDKVAVVLPMPSRWAEMEAGVWRSLGRAEKVASAWRSLLKVAAALLLFALAATYLARPGPEGPTDIFLQAMALRQTQPEMAKALLNTLRMRHPNSLAAAMVQKPALGPMDDPRPTLNRTVVYHFSEDEYVILVRKIRVGPFLDDEKQFLIAEVYRVKGAFSEAREMYESMLAHHPGSRFAQMARARLKRLPMN